MSQVIYTIGREFGSNGHTIGEKLAQKLNIPYYDKELLSRASKDSGFCQEILENCDEKPTSSFLYNLVFDTYSASGISTGNFLNMPLDQKVFLAQFETIKKIAEEGSCVIVGRCADYALADRDDVLSVFIKASEDYKIKNILEHYHDLDEKKAKDMMNKNDKKRASYYNYYSSKRWGDCKSYDLSINTADLGIDGCVEMIIEYANRKFR